MMNAQSSARRAVKSAAKSRPNAFGEHLREWRQRRHLSQLDLAGDAEISARHLSFVETGRAAPSRDMVLRLAERLDVPLRERNVLLVAAGFAPAFPNRSLDDPALAAARQAVETVLKAHEPYPALAVDRHWNLVSANAMIAMSADPKQSRPTGDPDRPSPVPPAVSGLLVLASIFVIFGFSAITGREPALITS